MCKLSFLGNRGPHSIQRQLKPMSGVCLQGGRFSLAAAVAADSWREPAACTNPNGSNCEIKLAPLVSGKPPHTIRRRQLEKSSTRPHTFGPQAMRREILDFAAAVHRFALSQVRVSVKLGGK